MNEQHRTAEARAPRRILVVDDDRDFADTLARLLTLEGHEVSRAYSIAAAEAELDRFPAEVALIDMRLGESSGLSLVSTLRQRRPEVICILMTAYSSVQTAIEALQEGAYDYLSKPFYSEELLATLKRCFERIALARAREHAESALRERNRELVDINRRLKRTESALRQRNRDLEELNARLQKSVCSMRALATFSSLRELCGAVLEEVTDTMGAQGGVVYLREAGQLIPQYSLGSGDLRAELPALEADALCRAQQNTAQSSAVPRPESDTLAADPRRPSEEMQVAFSLLGEEREPIGLVAVHACPDRAFTRQDCEFGEILVSFAGGAVRLVQALESLAWSEERLRDVIDNSPSSISLKDLEGRFVIVNRRFEEWYGHRQDEVAGKTSQDLFPEDLARLYTSQWKEVLNSDKVVEEEIEVSFADGKSHSVLVTAASPTTSTTCSLSSRATST
jgi:PAS domain S-box-containing protein